MLYVCPICRFKIQEKCQEKVENLAPILLSWGKSTAKYLILSDIQTVTKCEMVGMKYVPDRK